MAQDRYIGPIPEAKLDSARKLLKTTGLADAASALAEVFPRIRVEIGTGSFGNGYYVDPCLKLAGEWFPNGTAPMKTDSGVFDGTKNQRGEVYLKVPVRQLDSMGGGTVVMGGFVETNMDCVAGEEIVETPVVKANLSPIELSVPGFGVYTGDIDPGMAYQFLEYAVESGLVPQDSVDYVFRALASKGYRI